MDPKLRVQNPAGYILARDNFVLAGFSKRPFSEIATAAGQAFELWLKLVPEVSIKSALIGTTATRYTKATPNALDRCRAMIKDLPTKKNVYLEILGPQIQGPDYRLIVNGYVKPSKIAFADQTNLIEFVFPREFCSDYGEDRFVELAVLFFDILAPDSGYAAPALCYGLRGQYAVAGEFITPLAMRHHGYDVPNNVGTAVTMGKKCRGARWLTMLSAEMVDQIGGAACLQTQLAEGTSVLELAKGVLIRAGSKPEMGDNNKRELTPLLSSVAHAIEPVTYFHDNSILPIFGHNEEKRDRWERRFWWNEE